MQAYRNSYVLTFIGYNAGRGRANQWINQYGDPRDPKVDIVDWVERIPLSETRYYVQRVMENLQVYQALSGNRRGLTIEADLQRGG
jgi:soluble lytic murein transglycosylase